MFMPFNKLASLFFTLGLLLTIGTGPTFAESDTKSETTAAADASTVETDDTNRFTMNMRDADLRAFIQWVADRTGKNILVHRSVQGKVTVISSRQVTADEAYELFLTVLRLNGFAAVDTGGATKIIPEAEAKLSLIHI